MDRVCFRLQVDPDRSRSTASGMLTCGRTCAHALSDAGWRNYSLFLADDGSSSATSSADDFDAAQAAMAATDVNARWQAEMAAFFVDLGDSRPDEGMRPLTEVFHLD